MQERCRCEEKEKQADAKWLFGALLESRNLDVYWSLMNDVPIQSVNGTTLRALDYIFSDHERDHHSYMNSAKYTHSVNSEYQANFPWGYSMSSCEELVQPHRKESISWAMEHRFVHIGYGRDHVLSSMSGGNSSTRCIFMPSKADSL